MENRQIATIAAAVEAVEGGFVAILELSGPNGEQDVLRSPIFPTEQEAEVALVDIKPYLERLIQNWGGNVLRYEEA